MKPQNLTLDGSSTTSPSQEKPYTRHPSPVPHLEPGLVELLDEEDVLGEGIGGLHSDGPAAVVGLRAQGERQRHWSLATLQ